eukprot:5268434-Pyramimonas_sp.AAC.1
MYTSGAHQFDAADDGARYRALCAVVRRSRHDRGRPHLREHRQRHDPTGGIQPISRDLKLHTPCRAGQTRSSEPPEEQSSAR